MFLEIIFPIFVFATFTVIITVLILISYRFFTPQHKVQLKVNGAKPLSVQAGQDVLSVLQQNEVFLPSSCGGKGTCGLCCCKMSPVPLPLPIEKNFLSAKELNKDVRLACQHHLNIDLDVELPDSVVSAKKLVGVISEIKSLSQEVKEFTIKLKDKFSFLPGDYILVDIPAGDEVLTRAYSISSFPNELESEVKITVALAVSPEPEVLPAGIGSSYLFSLKEGDPLEVSGPFGEFHLIDSVREKCFIGGGVGVAPLRSMVKSLLLDSSLKNDSSLWLGVRDVESLVYDGEFSELQQSHEHFCYSYSFSEAGKGGDDELCYIHEAVYEKFLKDRNAPEDIEFYLCGPAKMLEATVAMLHSVGVDDDMIFFDNFG